MRRLATHCAGRVRYWQCDNEPSNHGLLWAGTADEYLAQLTALHAAVKQADPDARVVLGGCGYDVFSSPTGSPERQFFDHLAGKGRDVFDVFDIHLYGDPLRVPEYVATAQAFMRAHGYEKPIVAGEQGGPVLFEFPELEHYFQEPLPDLYKRMNRLPPKLQMFMEGCPPAARGQASPHQRPATGRADRARVGQRDPAHRRTGTWPPRSPAGTTRTRS